MVEKKGDTLEVVAKVTTAPKAKTSAYHNGSNRLFVGAPRLENTDAAKVLIYEVRPATEAAPGPARK